jgi:hypothetical protein
MDGQLRDTERVSFVMIETLTCRSDRHVVEHHANPHHQSQSDHLPHLTYARYVGMKIIY